MLALPPPLRALLFCALFSSTHAMPPRSIFERGATCAASSLVSCPSDLPDTFCCPARTACIALANNTTALCCTEGLTCRKIRPLSCNMGLQDADKDPAAKVKTTALDSELPKCGRGCCPFGYTCNDMAECVMDDDQSEPPPLPPRVSPTVSTSAPARTGGSSSTATPIPGEGSTNDGDDDDDDDNNKNKGDGPFPTTAVVLGVLFGVLALVAIAVSVIFWLARRRKDGNNKNRPGYLSKPSPRPSLASSSFGNIISDPIAGPDTAVRTDFIRKPESTRSAFSDRSSRLFRAQARPRPRSQSASSSSSGSRSAGGGGGGVSVPPIRGMRSSNSHARSPAADGSRRLSGVSIDVFAAPGTVGERRDTTFTEMMDGAGLGAVHKGGQFVPGTTPRI